jgi:hypothetical protein
LLGLFAGPLAVLLLFCPPLFGLPVLLGVFFFAQRLCQS